MAFFDRTFSASPVLVMPSQSVRQSPFGAPSFPRQGPFNSLSGFGSNSTLPRSYVSPSRGRKRSRDEASENLDDRASTATAKLERSGTWADEKEFESVQSTTLASRKQDENESAVRRSKSQRLDVTASQPASGLHSNCSSPAGAASKPSSPASPLSLDATTTPVVDDCTLAFGIGWRLMNADSSMSAAVRGWARYIENHYPVSNIRIHAESKGLQSYLVEAIEGWFLFDENLRQGRLVSTNNQRCIQNLKSSPPVFEGAETMTPSASAKSGSPLFRPSEMDTDMN